MFPAIEHRGKDATGWMYLDTRGTLRVFKQAAKASSVVDRLDPDGDNNKTTAIPDDVLWWIGHVRLATHGHESNPHNNHPIEHGNFIGVHNGLVYNYYGILQDTGREHNDARVDSEALFAAMNKYGVIEGLDKVDALAAIAFVDKRDPDTVYLATTDANPCIVGITKSGATYFASEIQILEALELDLAEPLFQLQDYQLYEIKGGKCSRYIQWADPDEKDRMGWGYRNYQSSGWSGVYQGNGSFSPEGNWWDYTGYQCIICGWKGQDYVNDCPDCGAPDDCLMEIDWEDESRFEDELRKMRDNEEAVMPIYEDLDDWMSRNVPKHDRDLLYTADKFMSTGVTKEQGRVYYILDGDVLTPEEYGERLKEVLHG